MGKDMSDAAPTKALLTPEDLVATGVSHLYTNGFQLGIGNSDVNLVLKLDNDPQLVVHLSYTLAKTLAVKLANAVEQLEEAVDRKILVTDELDAAFKARAIASDVEDKAS